MRRRILLTGLIVMSAAAASAQQSQAIDPVSVSPDKYRVLLENEAVRVVEYSLKPGEKDNPHTHPPRVSYVLSGGSLRITQDSSFVSNDSTGEVTWRGETPRHFVQNVGTSPVRILLFEIKSVELPRVSYAKDPARVNPASIAVRLENDSVRVMIADLPVGYQEKMHSHTPYVMYILGGGRVRMHMEDGQTREAELNTGDVMFSNPVTHWAENIGKTPIKVLLVEIRRK